MMHIVFKRAFDQTLLSCMVYVLFSYVNLPAFLMHANYPSPGIKVHSHQRNNIQTSGKFPVMTYECYEYSNSAF